MTRAQAATVAAAITNAGFPASIQASPDVNSGWRIVVNVRTQDNLDVATVHNFAVAQGITALITQVEFS